MLFSVYMGLQLLLSNSFAVALCRKKKKKSVLNLCYLDKWLIILLPTYDACLYEDSIHFQLTLFMVLKIKYMYET